MADAPWRLEKLVLPNGLGLRFAVAGDGPLMVLLHGFPESYYSWRHQLRHFSDRYTCVAPEMRGYGQTDAPAGIAKYTLQALVDDVAGLVRTLGFERAIIVGHDWGGAVAWGVAITRPEIVERLIVLNCPHPVKMREHLRSNLRQIRRSWYMFFFQLPVLPELLLRMNNRALIKRTIRSTAVQKQAFSDQDLEEIARAFERPESATAAVNYYRAAIRGGLLWRSRAANLLRRKITAPTLLIWGEQDVALGKELTLGMEDLFAGPFEIKYIPDAGHWVQQEKPELVNQYIAEFLQTANPQA